MGAQEGWPRAAAPVGSCPSSAEPAPDLVLPVIALLRPDLSETHSLHLLTILQSPGCPGLGVQLTAMEHPSIQQTWTEPLLGPKHQSRHCVWALILPSVEFQVS